jgi:hypothetical protein
MLVFSGSLVFTGLWPSPLVLLFFDNCTLFALWAVSPVTTITTLVFLCCQSLRGGIYICTVISVWYARFGLLWILQSIPAVIVIVPAFLGGYVT